MAFEVPKRVKPMLDFTVHVIIGAIAFTVVFGVASAISLIVKAADGIVPHWVASGGEFAEKGLFAMDLLCFGLFVLNEVLHLMRGLWNEWRLP
jgi:hypothetical protein